MTASDPAHEASAPAPRPGAAGIAGPEHVVSQFGLGPLLTRPAFLTRSPWLDHIPFAFWLMEAQRPRTFVELGTGDGASYFAFCQAAGRMDMDVNCFSVSTAEQDGAEPTDPARLRQHNEAHYAAFSRLQTGDPEETAQYFSDTQVDLLHIDAIMSFDRARACLDAWRPVLSPRAVVLLHNSDVRASGHGVAQLARTLAETYPTFRFRHGNGLTVIAVGPDQPDPLVRLFEANTNPAARGAIQTIFSRLGRACADSHFVQEYHDLYHQALAQIDALRASSGTTAPPRTSPTRQAALPDVHARVAPPAADPQELDSLRHEVAMQRAGAQARFEEIAALTRMVQALEAERHSYSPIVDWDRQEQEKTLAALRAQIAEREQERAEWERMYNEIRNSTSWKISRPVRWLAGIRRR